MKKLIQFSLVLHPTYYREGFFNVRKPFEGYFGDHGEEMTLFLGNDAQPILGFINRKSANKNHTPRIYGRTALSDWFQRNFSEKGEITIEVMSPTSIRLSSNQFV
ncbi:MAG: hypothetical protein WCI01_10770 [Chlorobiaceae bacterium]